MEQIGRYVIHGEIGRGGFGKVYRAWDPVVHRNVAIKVLTAMNDPGMLARFRSEAGTTGSLKHRNIITIYDFGEHDGAPYLVMELLEGLSLRQVIQDAQLTLLDKVRMLGEVAQGLSHAHQHAVVHRDIKPANVMLLSDGSVKILDFGIARLLDRNMTRQTSMGTLIGTAEYMAPELFEGADASPVTDIFSFGVLCYELLTGSQPFTATSPLAVIKLVATRDAEPLRRVVPDCPVELQSMVETAMAKRPVERYQSLQDLLFDLAPIEAELRRKGADSLAAKAQQALDASDLVSAQKIVFKALELDPTHPASQEIRKRVQRQREKLAVEQRLEKASAEVETLLQQRSFDQAIQALESILEWPAPEWTGYWRANIEAKLSAVREAREQHLHLSALLAEAQTAAERHDPAAASEKAALVLAIDPHNTAALEVQRWALVQTARALHGPPEQEAETLAIGPAAVPVLAPPQSTALPATRWRPRVRTMIVAATGVLVLAGGIALFWRRAVPTPPVPASMQDQHPTISGIIQTAFVEERWADALDAIRTLQQLSPSDPRLPAWEQKAVAGLERSRQIDTIRSITASAIEAKDWKASEKGLEELLRTIPNDQQVIAWQKLLQDGKPMELLAAMRSDRENRIANLRSAVDMSLSKRDWKAARRNIDELAKLSPPDRSISEMQNRVAAGTAQDEQRSKQGLPPASAASTTAAAAPAGPMETAASPRPGETLLNPKDGLTYVWIPKGTYLMGCSPDDEVCLDREKPPHAVTISQGFWIGQTEVTQEAYRLVKGVNPSNFKGPNRPVDNISWEDARSYCEAVGLRLPTEAEWEYAARAGTAASRYGDLDAIAWYNGNSGGTTHEVAQKQPNAWGLYDMLGNVWEWVGDWSTEQYVPGGAIDPQGPPMGMYRVLRGTAEDVNSKAARVSNRLAAIATSHGSVFGVRCAGN